MAERGICSRREADRLIERGQVLVDGKVQNQLGVRIDRNQRIELVESALRAQQQLATILVNKPRGYVSGTPEDGHQSALTLITRANRQHRFDETPALRGLAPAGRLDIDSLGLLVYTQDGRIARQLIDAQSRIEKEYLVWVVGALSADKIAQLCDGLWLDGRALRRAKVEPLKKPTAQPALLRITLTEGRKRQIRRMCELVELRVVRLLRVRIGAVTLGALHAGKWRRLQADEQF